jgi:hypothetical protein
MSDPEQNSSNDPKAQAGFAPANGSAACPDFEVVYRMKDGEEILNMSANVARKALPEVFKACETIKSKMAASEAPPNAKLTDRRNEDGN